MILTRWLYLVWHVLVMWPLKLKLASAAMVTGTAGASFSFPPRHFVGSDLNSTINCIPYKYKYTIRTRGSRVTHSRRHSDSSARCGERKISVPPVSPLDGGTHRLRSSSVPTTLFL